jgi:peptide/nickel transport system substrate-binding protein
VVNIPNYQTGLAALRTGQVDVGNGITWEDAESLWKTNPELLYRGTLNFYNPVIEMRNDLAPFSDINFRKALAIAIDRKGIVRDFYKGNGDVLTWPYYPELQNIYTPLDKLPADAQELFNYDPVKAKQLLTQAGFPGGYKIELMVPNYAPFPDLANIIKSYWDAVGVNTTVKVMDGGAFYGSMYGNNYSQTALVHWSNGDPMTIFSTAYYKGRLYNYSKVDDPYVIETYDKLIKTPDGPEQDAIFREAGPKVLAKTYNIAMPAFYQYTFWQPWLKEYHGEMWGGFASRWLDLEMRKKATGK